jgi:hypothetical protein
MHEKFVKEMIKNESKNNVKHLVFGGDSVWIGFLNCQWERFAKIMKLFSAEGIKIYPALGNHELCELTVLYYFYKKFNKKKDSSKIGNLISSINRIEDKSDVERFLKNKELMKAFVSEIKKESKKIEFKTGENKFLEELIKEDRLEDENKATIMNKIIEKKISQTAEATGIFELQESLKKKGINDEFLIRFKYYITKCGWNHLEKIIKNTTYYSLKLPEPPEEKPKVKIIVLDSNISISDYQEQKEWYLKQLEEDSLPIIVVAHHPEIFYPENRWKDWGHDGWFNIKKPHLILTGHHHDYERLSKDKKPPIYIISGSGGAHLDTDAKIDEKEVTKTYKNVTIKHTSKYNYVRVVVKPKSDEIFIKVFGWDEESKAFHKDPIDELKFKWKAEEKS